MARSLADARQWVRQGTSLVDAAIAGLDDDTYSADTLPGWTRRNLVGHISANAVAVGNLVKWAATGEPTPMYVSMEQRNADIEAAGLLSAAELTASFRRTAAALEAAMDALTEDQWSVEVTTAQGRTLPASEVPWLRSREVMIHAIDLGTGVGFTDLPPDFLWALCDDIVAKRSGAVGPALVLTASDVSGTWTIDGDGATVTVTGMLADITGYLAGRPASGVLAADGSPAPQLSAWL